VKVPDHIQQWLDARALAVVPVAAAELLDAEVPVAERLAVVSEQLHQMAALESDTPLGDLLRLRQHEADRLLEVHHAAEKLIALMPKRHQTEAAYAEWRKAVYRYERRSA
jgi:hypothetical protein